MKASLFPVVPYYAEHRVPNQSPHEQLCRLHPSCSPSNSIHPIGDSITFLLLNREEGTDLHREDVWIFPNFFSLDDVSCGGLGEQSFVPRNPCFGISSLTSFEFES